MLKSHPNVFVPKLKDTYFFNRFAYKGHKKYLKNFRNSRSKHKAVGELSHDYIFDDLARARIAKSLPDATILMVLRNPADRSVSHWKFRKRSGVAGADYRDDFFDCKALVDHGNYGEFVAKWRSSFPKEQVCELSFQALRTEQSKLCKTLGDVLNVDPESFPQDLQKPMNAAFRPKSYVLVELARGLGNVLRYIGLGGFWGAIKSSRILKKHLFHKSAEQPTTLVNFRSAICKKFRSDISRLEKYTDLPWTELRS